MLQFLEWLGLVGFVKSYWSFFQTFYVTIQVRIWWDSHWDTVFQKLAREAQEVAWSEGGGGGGEWRAGVRVWRPGQKLPPNKRNWHFRSRLHLVAAFFTKVSERKGTDNFHKWVPKHFRNSFLFVSPRGGKNSSPGCIEGCFWRLWFWSLAPVSHSSGDGWPLSPPPSDSHGPFIPDYS